MSLRVQSVRAACHTRLCRPASCPHIAAISHQPYATQSTSSKPTRRAITVTSDDGRYHWSELSTGEKAARTTQQSFNFVFVTAGAAGTLLVTYFLYQELFAADSKTRQFNRAVFRIKDDPDCCRILGPSDQIKAYGEATSSKWARSRPLAHSTEVDKFGTTHFRMHFNVEGPDAAGTVNIHMIKRRGDDDLRYQTLSLSVPGHQTIHLENADTGSAKKTLGRMFGVQWR